VQLMFMLEMLRDKKEEDVDRAEGKPNGDDNANGPIRVLPT